MMQSQLNLTKQLVALSSVSRMRPWRLGCLVAGVALASLALAPNARSICREGCDETNANTFLGADALVNNTSGFNNTAIGADALVFNTTGYQNTATGVNALFFNTSGHDNTASGINALRDNTTGFNNTATGIGALQSNTTGSYNTASGWFALYLNTTGSTNTAIGVQALQGNTIGDGNTASGVSALFSNTTGSGNTASGFQALLSNTTGSGNTATGGGALVSNTTGSGNTASGAEALNGNTIGNNNTASGVGALFNNTTGNDNIALGYSAGFNLSTGSSNIDIGNAGVAGDSAAIRIGTPGTQTSTFVAGIRGVAITGAQAVGVNANGQLGTRASSARFKEAIRSMDKASEAILALRPVSFRYKKELDPKGTPQFGLVAEEVAKVDPDLVLTNENGRPFTVRYEEVNVMLLNEFLKEHHAVQELKSTAAKQKAIIAKQQKEFQLAIAQQQKEIKGLIASLKEQALQIQKVRAQLEITKPAPQMVANGQ